MGDRHIARTLATQNSTTQKNANVRECIQKFPDRVEKEIYTYLWYYSLLSASKGYGGKTR